MELSIIRRETTGAPPNQYNESETITKFEIMDGAPVRGETIPIRLFLGGFELTPTFRDGKFLFWEDAADADLIIAYYGSVSDSILYFFNYVLLNLVNMKFCSLLLELGPCR